MEQTSTPVTGLARVYESIARWAIIFMAGLVPLTFLPATVDQLEVNKQTLVIILASVAVIAWLGSMVVRKQFVFRKSWLFALGGLFLLSALLSSAFSIAPYVSWIGQNTLEYSSFISLLSFVMVLLAGGHLLSETSAQRSLWSVMMLSSGVMSILVLLNYAGLTIPSNLVGTPNALGLYFVTMSVLGAGLYLVTSDMKTHDVLPGGVLGVLVRIAIVLTTIAALVVLISVDFWALWIALIVGVIVVFTFALIRANEFPHTSRFILPMILFVAAVLFLFIPSVLPGRFSVEVAPSHSATWGIATKTLGDTNVLFGSGPGTFVMNYTKFKPVEINQTAFWDARFDRGSSQMLTMLATFGVLGVGFMLALIVGLLTASLKMLIKEKTHDEWKMTFVAFAGWSVVTFGMFTYASNFTLSFLFWLLSAVLVSQVAPKQKIWQFARSPRLALLTAFLFVIVNVGLLTMLFVTLSRYASELAFARAVEADQSGEELDVVLEDLSAAARLNKLSDIYYRNYSHALLLKTADAVMDPEVTPETLQALIAASINSGVRATELSPSYVVNWSQLGDVYREVAPLVGDADIAAVEAYTRAIELAPENPKYYVARARAYLVHAQQLDILATSDDPEFSAQAQAAAQTATSSAITDLQQAIELKGDYAPAHYYLAVAYEREGNLSEAVSSMQALLQAYPLDIGLGFQLGLLYLKQGKNDFAQTTFERVIEIAPNYSNARWYLSAVYEQDGNFDAAIAQVEALKQLNPDNPLIDQRLQALREGKTAAELPLPLEEGDGDITQINEPVFEEVQE